MFVGEFKDKRLAALAMEYEKRLSRLMPVAVRTLRESDRPVREAWQAARRRGEAVSLDPAGEVMDSVTFARWVMGSPRNLAFFAWGAAGPRVGWVEGKHRKVSLTPLTTSHELARVLLMEQLYRVGCGLRCHPYPK